MGITLKGNDIYRMCEIIMSKPYSKQPRDMPIDQHTPILNIPLKRPIFDNDRKVKLSTLDFVFPDRPLDETTSAREVVDMFSVLGLSKAFLKSMVSADAEYIRITLTKHGLTKAI